VTSHALFDLDGTLVDSAPGITRSLEDALRAVGVTPPPPAVLTGLIGTPLLEVFAGLLPDASRSTREQAVAAYLASFDAFGIRLGLPYPGIAEALKGLDAEGLVLYVATVKRQEVAERVIEHVGLAGLFRAVYGSRPDRGIATKTDVLAHALEAAGIEPARAAMVGDRHHDVDAARALGTRAVGVAWGYGSLDELRDAAAIVHAPDDLLAALRPHTAERRTGR